VTKNRSSGFSLARCEQEETGGRPAERWYAADPSDDIDDKNDISPAGASAGGASVVNVVNVVGLDDEYRG
jgi:hypothetical protein